MPAEVSFQIKSEFDFDLIEGLLRRGERAGSDAD
jgi:hypothetical protein